MNVVFEDSHAGEFPSQTDQDHWESHCILLFPWEAASCLPVALAWSLLCHLVLEDRYHCSAFPAAEGDNKKLCVLCTPVPSPGPTPAWGSRLPGSPGHEEQGARLITLSQHVAAVHISPPESHRAHPSTHSCSGEPHPQKWSRSEVQMWHKGLEMMLHLTRWSRESSCLPESPACLGQASFPSIASQALASTGFLGFLSGGEVVAVCCPPFPISTLSSVRYPPITHEQGPALHHLSESSGPSNPLGNMSSHSIGNRS